MRLTRFQIISTWMLETTRGRICLWLVECVALFAGALLSAWMLYQTEHYALPVIKDWKLESVEREGDYWVVRGTMNKVRSCELVATSVMAVPKMPLAPRVLVYQIKPSEILGGNAPTGLVTWGPWSMEIPKALLQHRDDISSLEVIGHHRCHALWTQETLYGSVRMEALP